MYHFYYKNKIQEEVDNSTITMEDYSIEVHGLPLDATEESVRAHFEQLCGPVHEVTFGRDLRGCSSAESKLRSSRATSC